MRDPDTWPADAVAPEPDDDFADSPVFQPTASRTPIEVSSGMTSPWKGTNAIVDDGIEASISRQASGIGGR